MEDSAAKLEALLFIYGEPMDIKKAAQTLEVKPKEVEAAIAKLSESLEADGRGLMLVRQGEQIQLTTKPVFSSLLEKVIKAELHEALTPAGLETLSIIAYGGPIVRSEIDYIRGVNSSFILRNLLLRGLIDRAPDPHRGNAYLYTPSFEFLKHIGVSNVSELPEYKTFADLAMKVKQPTMAVSPAVASEAPTLALSGDTSTGSVQDGNIGPISPISPIEESASEVDKPAAAEALADKLADKPKKKEPSLSDEIAEMFQSQQKAPEGLEGSEFDGSPEIE